MRTIKFFARNISLNAFLKILSKMFEEDGRFVTYTNSEHCFEHLADNEMVICGEDLNQTFAITVIKVNPDERGGEQNAENRTSNQNNF